MKRILFALLIIVMMFSALPIVAQEATPEPTPVVSEPNVVFDVVPVNVFVAVVVLLSAVAVGALFVIAYLQGKSTKAIWQSSPQPVQQVGRTGLEFLLNEAARTETTLDDEWLQQLAKAIGYKVTILEDGRVILTPDSTL